MLGSSPGGLPRDPRRVSSTGSPARGQACVDHSCRGRSHEVLVEHEAEFALEPFDDGRPGPDPDPVADGPYRNWEAPGTALAFDEKPNRFTGPIDSLSDVRDRDEVLIESDHDGVREEILQGNHKSERCVLLRRGLNRAADGDRSTGRFSRVLNESSVIGPVRTASIAHRSAGIAGKAGAAALPHSHPANGQGALVNLERQPGGPGH